jgi:hypothetical protein
VKGKAPSSTSAGPRPPVLYRPVLSKNLSLYVAGVCPVPPVADTVFCCDWVVGTFTCGFERVNCSLQHAWLAEIVNVAPNATARNAAASRIDFVGMSAAPQVRDL